MDQKKQVANILGDRKAAADERIKEELSEEPLFEHTASIQSCSRSIESEPEVQATVSIDRPTTSDETLNATLQPNSSSQGVQDAISDDDHHDSKSQVVAPGPSDSLFESNVVEPFEFAHNVRPTRSITLRAHVHSPPPMSSNACRPPINESPLLLSSHSLPCLTDLSMAAVDCNRSNPMSPSHLADALVGQLSLDNGELVDEQSVIQLHFHAQSIGHPHSQSKRRVDGQDERSQVEHLSRNFVTRRSKHRTNRMKRSKSAQSNSSMLLQRSLSCSVGMMAPNLMRAPPVAATDHDHRHRHHHRSKSKHKDTNKSLDKHTFYFSSSSVHQTSASASSVADSLSSSYSSSSSSDSGSTSRTARAQLSARQRLILTSLCCLAFASQCSMSIIAPFFPYEASAKGISESVYGLVFSIHAFVVMVFSPLLGVVTPRLGAKRMLLCGILLSGMANIFFGALDYIENVTTFTYLCFVVRMAEALGSCAFSTASYVYIMHFFGDQLGWTFGVLETFVGLGMSLGPGIGGGLYGLGGYPLPFYLLGVITLVNFPFAWMVLPLLGNEMDDDPSNVKMGKHVKNIGQNGRQVVSAKEIDIKCVAINWPKDDSYNLSNPTSQSITAVQHPLVTKHPLSTTKSIEHYDSSSKSFESSIRLSRDHSYYDSSTSTSTSSDTHRYGSISKSRKGNDKLETLTYYKILIMPEVLLICLVVIVISQSQGFLDPTIEPHLRLYGVQPHLVGLVFLLMSAAYALTSPVVGWWASRTSSKFPIMALGCLITFVGLLLVGPSTITPFQPSLYFSIFGMIIIGIGFATAFIPTFEAILNQVTARGYADDVQTYSLVSGLWSSLFAMGEVIGPTLGGILSEFYDFPVASTFMAAVAFVTLLVILLAMLFESSFGHFRSDGKSHSIATSKRPSSNLNCAPSSSSSSTSSSLSQVERAPLLLSNGKHY